MSSPLWENLEWFVLLSLHVTKANEKHSCIICRQILPGYVFHYYEFRNNSWSSVDRKTCKGTDLAIFPDMALKKLNWMPLIFPAERKKIQVSFRRAPIFHPKLHASFLRDWKRFAFSGDAFSGSRLRW